MSICPVCGNIFSGKEQYETCPQCSARYPEPTKAEIMEEMCQQGGMLRRIMPSTTPDLSEGERTILQKKLTSRLGGRVSFPISETEREGMGEQIVRFYDDHPFEPPSLLAEAATPIDTATMESILRKVYKQSYDSQYELAKLRVISRKRA